MFNFEDPSDLDTDWYLGDKKKNSEYIPKKFLQKMSNFHLIGIQFLHENVRKRHGVILNEDEDMNMSLQVCTFLLALRDKITIQTPVIVICAENSLCTWHYHFSQVDLDPQIITSEDIVFDVNNIYLLSFESVKLFDKLKHLKFFCAIIDDFDTIATKLFVRKVTGMYRIGLTKRNFYTNPDQKLRWTMLNWASPGCVGKLKDFYHIDHLHSLAFADNYRFWWMRLTFKYCNSFEQPNDDEIQEYQQTLVQWGSKCGIPTNFKPKKSKSKTIAVKSKRSTIKPAGFKVRRNRKFTNRNFGYKDVSSSDEDNEPEIKKVKSEETIKTAKALTERASAVLEETIDTEITDKDVTLTENVEETKTIETTKELEKETIEASGDSDFSNFFNSPKREKRQLSDDEDPILSFITSREPEPEKNSDCDVKTVQSSDTDSDFFGDFVKNKDTTKRYYASQQISQVLDNLSDEELMKCGKVSDDDDFFSELILGKTE